MDHSQKSILLVDDNENDELLTLDALRRGGIGGDVHVVRDGAEALDWLFGTGMHSGRDTRRSPTLVLLDLKLPKIGGLEVLSRARADRRTRYIPIVVLSSSTQREDIATSYRNGASSYIRKAMNFDEFSETLRCIGNYWLRYNQPIPQD